MQALLQDSPVALWTCALLLGLLVGSFLNVVILRLPVMLERRWRAEALEAVGQSAPDDPPFDLVRPRSCCPACA